MTGNALILTAFGQKIRRLRKQRGESQDQLAERSELHRTYISDIERGYRNPSLSSIVQLAVALGVSPAALLDGIGPKG